jgi:drug/metabolite transporter (DMT)-like permease
MTIVSGTKSPQTRVAERRFATRSRTARSHKRENLALGAIFSLLAFFCLAVLSTLAKEAEEFTSTAVVLLFQNLICLLFLIPVTARRGASLRTDKIGVHILRAVTGTAAWYALFVAIKLMPLDNATLLVYSAPLWMPVIAWAVYRQRASMATWVGAAIGFVGVVLVLDPSHSHFNIGALFALAGALFLAVGLLSARRLATTEPMPRILFYYFFFSTVLVAPFALADWQPFGAQAWIYLIGIGLALLMSQALIVLAYRYAPAVKLAPFIYTVIVFTGLIEWAVFGQPPTMFDLVGMTLVIGGGIIAISLNGGGVATPRVATATET